MKKAILVLLFLFSINVTQSFSQSLVVSIDSIGVDENSEILVPLSVEGFMDVGAITLFIEYDTLVLDFLTIENITPELTGALFNNLESPEPTIGICWHNIEGLNIESGKLLDLKFFYSNGSSELTLNQNCEIASSGLELFTTEYIHGSVTRILKTQELIFTSGWNSLSSFLDPMNSDMDDFFTPIIESLIIASDGQQIYYPLEGINTIGDFDPYKGYFIKLSNDDTLSIDGYSLQNKNLLITEGWNYLPVLIPCEILIETLFDGMIGNLEIIKSIAGPEIFWPEMGISSLLMLEPGKSYLIKSTTSFELTFPGCE
nr:hypothetical protein [Bacteroidota bacterium]